MNKAIMYCIVSQSNSPFIRSAPQSHPIKAGLSVYPTIRPSVHKKF